MEKYKKIFFELIKIIKNGEESWIPASLAYSFIVSFVPIVFAFVMLAIKYFVDANEVKTMIANSGVDIPFLTEIIDNVQNNFSSTGIFLTILLVAYSIYMASGGIKSIIQANNHFFEFESKGGIYTWVASILVVIILLVSMLGAILIIGFIPELFKLLRLDVLIPYSYVIVLPVMFVVMYVIFKLVSGLRLKHNALWRGALVSSVGIFVIVTFSSLIIFAGSTAADIFGPLVTILLFAHFLFFIGQCIYYGMAVNVASYRVEKELAREKVINENTIYGQ